MKMHYSRRELYALGEPLGDSATYRKVDGGLVLGDGGGGGGQPTQQVVSSTELPDWAKSYAQQALATGQTLTSQGYQTYSGNRIAGFQPLQLDAQKAAANMEVSPLVGQAAGSAQQAITNALSANYSPGQFSNQFQAPAAYQAGTFTAKDVNAPSLRNYQMQAPSDVNAPTAVAARLGEAPTSTAAQFTGPQDTSFERVSAPGMGYTTMQAAQTGYAPSLSTYQMGPAQQVGTGAFTDPGTVQAYMNPYLQASLSPQMALLAQQQGIQGAQMAGQATQAGAFGGSRYGLLQANQNLNNQLSMSNLVGQGYNQAYNQAAQQYSTDAARQLAAQQSNQQANLSTAGQNLQAALGVQSLGTQTGLQTALANLNAQQQANVNNQAAQMQAAGMNATQALQAALANQQAGMNTQQFNAQQQYNTALQNAQMRQQTGLANQALAGQYGLQQGQMSQQANMLNAQQGLQAALANQQAGLTTAQQNLAANLQTQQLGASQSLQSQLANQSAALQAAQLGEQSRQFGAGQSLASAQAAAQYGQAAQQLGEQSRQFGANVGLQGAQTALQGAGQLGQLGQMDYSQQMGINQLQNQIGAQQQALEQQRLSQDYQDFLNQQNFQYKQLGFMSDLIRGIPLGQQSTSQMYQAPGSLMGQAAGLGLGAYGLSRLIAKDGGLMQSYASGGITGDDNTQTILSKLSDAQLAQAKQAALNSRDQEKLGLIEEELAERTSMRAGLGGAFNSLPTDYQDNIVSAAGGGIVAFAKGGDEGEYFKDPLGAPDYQGEDLSLRKLFGQNVRAGESYTPGLRGMLFGYDVLPAKEQPKSPAYADSDATERADRMTGTTASAAPTKVAPTDGGIKDALKIMAQTHGMSESDLSALYDREYAKISAENKPLLERLNKAIEKSAGRADKARADALPKALAEFGFQWAAAASKPGQARRAGLAGMLESAAAASPTLAASAAESQKAIDRAEDLQNQMQMEQAKFEMALKKGDRATAMQSVSNIRQMQIAMQQLKLQAQQIAQTGAFQQGQLGIMERDLTRKEGADKVRALSGLAGLQRAQASMAEVGRKAGLDFDNSREGRNLMKQLTEQHGNTDKAKYLYNQQRRSYISEATQGMRDQTDRDMQVRSVFDLLNAE